jgi:TRAP-type C4-dicarboxylate transport system substrate-binding protein
MKITGQAARAALAAVCLLAGGAAAAQEVTLKLHQFLPAQANVPRLILDKWADDVEAASGGRIEIDRFPSMQLGGAPPELIDQARDGIADVVWTVVGYTPGRFPRTEVFELPFFVEDAGAASAAFSEMMAGEMGAEFEGLEILGSWVHGPGVIHADRVVETPADLRGLKVRGASRQVNAMLETLGATPVGMPVPAVPEALSKGVIDGTTIPWEVTGSLKVPDLVTHHTEFTGPMLYTLAFVLVMNAEVYAGLPADLRAVIDAQSGRDFSVFAGRTMVAVDGPAREAALELGNAVLTLDAAQSAVWAEAAAPVYDAWLADMAARGIDGQALIDEARRRMAAFQE